MNIKLDNPIITYSEKGKPFIYDKLFLKTFAPYIEEYKNIPYERLTEKDQSVALARIIKKLYCNGVLVTEFFSKEMAQWDGLENHERIHNLLDIVTRDMFCCFDKNLESDDGEFAKVNRIYYVDNNGTKDYVMCNETEKKGLFGKKHKSPYTVYFEDLIERFEKGELPKSSQE